MDELTADTTMDIVEARQYPGVINSHGGWSSDPTIERMQAVGGAVGFNKSANTGNGLGSDINGLSSQPGPGSTPIQYPFRSRDRGTYFYRETYGDRTFDFNTDGVATYGLWIDWIEAAPRRRSGGEAATRCSAAPRTTCGCGKPPGGTRADLEFELKGKSLGKLIVIEHLTLDGVMQAPGAPDEDPRDGFEHGGWANQRQDPAMT